MLSQSELKKHIHYDPITGEFTRLGYYHNIWKTWVKRINILDKPSREGYIIIMLNGNPYKAHRLTFLYMNGVEVSDDMNVDHIDGNRTNNKFSNLRIVTDSENAKNKAVGKNSSTKVIGVSKYENRYRARINVNGKRISLGLFNTIEEAELVRKKYEKKYDYHENHGRVNESKT